MEEMKTILEALYDFKKSTKKISKKKKSYLFFYKGKKYKKNKFPS
jgi:hypothetical protein